MIRILVVDDHKLVRDGIKSVLLSVTQDIEIAGEAASGKEAIDFLEKQEVDVVLMDINMPEMNGLETTRYIREHFPQIKVLLLTMMDKEQAVLEATHVGAHGYVLKTAGHKELLHAIRMLAEGEEYFSTDIIKMLIQKIHPAPPAQETNVATASQAEALPVMPTQLPSGITRRELEVLQLIAHGYTTNEIAERLFTSKRTIETHRQNLLTKTHANNTASLIRFAVQQGLVR